MTDDPDADTRCNAAVALAHHGNTKAIETLAEMLDLEVPASVNEEKNEADQQTKRTVLIGSAINATHALADKIPKPIFHLSLRLWTVWCTPMRRRCRKRTSSRACCRRQRARLLLLANNWRPSRLRPANVQFTCKGFTLYRL